MEKNKTFTIKIVIVGEAAVGKTSLVKKFVSGQFIKDYRASIGTNMFTKEINLGLGIRIKILLMDIAGQERWTQIRHIYYEGTNGAIIVGDLTRKITFNQIEEIWYPDLKKYCKNSPIILIANKNDLKRNISEEEIIDLGDKINAKSIFSVSAKTGKNVEKAFKVIAELSINTIYNKDDNLV